ncbi:MerR-family transcriptional regulator (fragment) [Streptantibioticus cattleyicolor NRRL 8057 = DSM 46488]
MTERFACRRQSAQSPCGGMVAVSLRGQADDEATAEDLDAVRRDRDPLAWSALQGHSVETAEPNTRRVDASSRTTNENGGKW